MAKDDDGVVLFGVVTAILRFKRHDTQLLVRAVAETGHDRAVVTYACPRGREPRIGARVSIAVTIEGDHPGMTRSSQEDI